jgi:hypothetical protein
MHEKGSYSKGNEILEYFGIYVYQNCEVKILFRIQYRS